MWIPLLAVVLILFSFLPPQVYSVHNMNFLFFLYHANTAHLIRNLLTLSLAYLIAKSLGVDEKKLIEVFLASSAMMIPLANIFDLKIIGASAGIYGMIGYMLRDMARLANPFLLFVIFVATIFLDTSPASSWEKMLHLVGFLTGMAIRSLERPYRYEELAPVMTKEEYYGRVM